MANAPAIFGAGGFAQFISPTPGEIYSDGSINRSDGVYNYIANGHFEQGIVGPALFNTTIGGQQLPTGTVGAGASGLTASWNTSTPLNGTGSLQVTSTTGWPGGQGIIFPAFTMQTGDLGKVLYYSMNYSVTAGASGMGFSGNVAALTQSFIAYIYDVTAGAWLQPSGFAGMNQSSNTGTLTGNFQASVVAGQQYQLAFLCVNTTSGSGTILFDSVSVSRQAISFGPATTDWVAYAPTLTGVGTATSVQFQSRRVGDSLEIQGKFTTGTVSGTTASATLGFNGSNSNVTAADTTKIPSIMVCGYMTAGAVSASAFGPLATASTQTVTFGLQNGSNAGLTSAAGTTIFASATAYSFFALVPIQGWSSNLQISSDTLTQVVAATITGTPPNANTALTPIILPTVVKDTAGGYSVSTGQYTAPVSGFYSVSFYVSSAQYGSSTVGYVYVAGAQAAVAGQGGSAGTVPGSATVFATAGQTIDIRASVTSTSGSGPASLSIVRASGPSVVANTESVNARYFSSSTSITGTLATVVYSTKAFDTHGAYNAATGIYTAPVSGKYQVNASIAMTGTFVLNSTLDLQVQQTGSNTQISESKSFSGGAVTQMNTNVGDIFYLLAGDAIKVQASNSGTTPVIAATTTQNWLSIARVGN